VNEKKNCGKTGSLVCESQILPLDPLGCQEKNKAESASRQRRSNMPPGSSSVGGQPSKHCQFLGRWLRLFYYVYVGEGDEEALVLRDEYVRGAHGWMPGEMEANVSMSGTAQARFRCPFFF
jgi:hypothetical protein